MNKMPTERRAAILSALVEGNSIASTCRMLGVSKVTVLRLLADAGTLAERWHNLTVRELATKRVQVDEIWSFIHSKEDHVREENWGKGHGDTWTWVAIDADSKLVINWHIGGRDQGAATLFVADLAERLTDRIQLTSDGWGPYRMAVNRAFGTEVDYAMLVKEYAAQHQGYARYTDPAKLMEGVGPRLDLAEKEYGKLTKADVSWWSRSWEVRTDFRPTIAPIGSSRDCRDVFTCNGRGWNGPPGFKRFVSCREVSITTGLDMEEIMTAQNPILQYSRC